MTKTKKQPMKAVRGWMTTIGGKPVMVSFTKHNVVNRTPWKKRVFRVLITPINPTKR